MRNPNAPWEIRNDAARKAWVKRTRASMSPEMQALADRLLKEMERLMGPSDPMAIEEFRRFSAPSAADVALQKPHRHIVTSRSD